MMFEAIKEIDNVVRAYLLRRDDRKRVTRTQIEKKGCLKTSRNFPSLVEVLTSGIS